MTRQYENIYMKRFSYFNLYVIKGKKGDILIDTGFICMKRQIKKWLDNFNIKLIILTHAHVDHIWNVSYLKNLYNCEVALSKQDIENIDNKNIKSKPRNKILSGWTLLMNFGMKHFTAKKFEIDITLEEDQLLKKYGCKLKVHNLEGHTNGSIGIEYKQYLFVGDALVNRFKVTEAYQNQNPNNAKKSALKIIELKPKITFLGHDKPVSFEKLQKHLT